MLLKADREHLNTILLLTAEALHLAGYVDSLSEIGDALVRCFPDDAIGAVNRLFGAQGVAQGALESRVAAIGNFSELPVVSEKSGTLRSVDLKRLKEVVLRIYSLVNPANPFVVWEAGVFWKAPRTTIGEGDEIAVIRVGPRFAETVSPQLGEISASLNSCLDVSETEMAPERARAPQVLGVVDENGELRKGIVEEPVSLVLTRRGEQGVQ